MEIIGVILWVMVFFAPLVCCCLLLSREILWKERSFGKTVGALLLWAVFSVLCLPLCLLVLCIRRWGWLGGTLRAVGSAALWVILLVGGLCLAFPGEVYETDNLADYRVVTGNYNNDRPQAFIDSFFPAEIGPEYVDAAWHYKAIKLDSIACEAVLTFTLPGQAAFDAHYSDLSRHGEPQPFPFDERYEMWVIDNHIDSWTQAERGRSDRENAHVRNIESACVGLILCDREAQRFVYFALMVHDGGATDETDLNHFLTRFDVDLLTFEQMIAQ